MKMFLLCFLSGLLSIHAQSEVVPKSAVGAGEGANGPVNAVVVQADGKIVIGGSLRHPDLRGKRMI